MIDHEFPYHVFPQTINDFIEFQGKHRPISKNYISGSILATTAAIIGNSYWIQVQPGYTIPCILWVGLVGRSGSAKSPAIKIASKPLEQINNARYDEYRTNMAAYKTNKGDKEPKPLFKQLILNDTTMEGMLDALNINPNGILMIKDELITLVTDGKRYNNSSNESYLLSLFDSSSITVNRKHADPFRVQDPNATILGGIQPKILKDLFGESRASNGFIPRVLLVYPESNISNRTIPSDDDSIIVDYNDIMTRLFYALEEQKTKRIIQLTDEALDYYLDLEERYNIQFKKESSDLLGSYYKKLSGIVVRLALILEVLKNHEIKSITHSISLESMQNAKEMADYFFATMKYAESSIIGERKEDPINKLRGEIIDSLLLNQNPRQIVQELHLNGYRNAEIAKAMNKPTSTISDWCK